MQKLFAYPIKPYIVNQPWGRHDPQTYSQFGFTDHNGIDMGFRDPEGHWLLNKEIYAPCDSTVYAVFDEPKGGGHVLSLLTDPIAFDAFTCTTPDGRSVDFRAGTYRIRIDFLHLDHATVTPGQRVTLGDLIAIGDNTGFSTGPHCHTQWRRVLDKPGIPAADKNEANNSFDPTQFFDGFYAKDAQTVIQAFQTIIAILTRIIALKSSA